MEINPHNKFKKVITPLILIVIQGYNLLNLTTLLTQNRIIFLFLMTFPKSKRVECSKSPVAICIYVLIVLI